MGSPSVKPPFTRGVNRELCLLGVSRLGRGCALVRLPLSPVLASGQSIGGVLVPQLHLKTEGPEAGGHGGEVFAVAFSSDGGFVLSGGWDGYLRLWEVTTGAPLTGLPASTKAISACAIAPSGSEWFAGGMDGLLSTWDPMTHRQLSAIAAHTRPISAILFSPDDTTLATTSWDCAIALHNRSGVGERRTLVGHDDIVAGCRFTPDGSHLFSWSHDGTARLWNLAQVKCQVKLTAHEDRVTAGAVAPDGVWAATGARDRTLTLWDLRAQRPAVSRSLAGEVRACFFLLDGESLVTIDEHGRLVLHSIPDLEERQELLARRPVQCAELAPDGMTIALGCGDGRVCFVTVDGLDGAPLFVTPTQRTRQTQGPLQRLLGRKRITHAYACTCPSCRHAFELPNGSLGQSAACPSCRRLLRLSQVARLA
jgi:WD40 repeat protein